MWKDVSATTQANDGDSRCSNGVDAKNCFTWVPGGSLWSGAYDFLIYELYLPTKDDLSVIDLGQISYDVTIPSDAEGRDVKLELSCDSPSNYFKNSTYGQPSDTPNFIDVSPVTAGHTNGYSGVPTLKIASHKAEIEYGGEYVASSVGGAQNYWGVIPVKMVERTSTSASGTGLDCEAKWTITDETGFSYVAMKIDENDNGPYILEKHSTRIRDNFYRGERITRADDKYYLNWDSDYADRTWRNGEGFDYQVELKLQWGLAKNSWCMGAVPKYLTSYIDESLSNDNAIGA